MLNLNAIVIGDVVKRTETKVLYIITSVDREKGRVRVKRRTPRSDVRRTYPYANLQGNFYPAAGFEEAVCPELEELEKDEILS